MIKNIHKKTLVSRQIDKNKNEWEKRSKLWGSSLKSVLMKNMPEMVNKHFSNLHEYVIFENIDFKPNIKILDAGCGYGRLTLPIIKKYPKVDISGMDISKNFVQLYKQTTKRPAFIGTLEDLKGKPNCFDYIICVTVLMFTNREKLKQAVDNMLHLLRPKGKIIMIESSNPIKIYKPLSLFFAKLENIFGGNKVNTGGLYLETELVESLFDKGGAVIEKEYYFPLTTIFIVPLFILGKILPTIIMNKLLGIFYATDIKLSRYKLPSLYVGYIISKR